MARKTSIEAYIAIKANGLLKEREFAVYEAICHHGPVTAGDVARITGIEKNTVSPRMTALIEKGVIEETGNAKVNSDTNRKGVLLVATGDLPHKRKKRDRPTCTWTPDNLNILWSTSCGTNFSLPNGTPKSNRFKHCPHCGKRIKHEQDI